MANQRSDAGTGSTEPGAKSGASPGHRIVVGVDGSPSSAKALAWAAQQAALTGATLEMVTAWHYPVYFGTTPVWPADFDPQTVAEAGVREAADAVLRDHPGLQVRTTVREADPAVALLDAARGAGLLVVGSRGHGAFAGMLLGSVSQHCAAHAPCPVLVMHEEDT